MRIGKYKIGRYSAIIKKTYADGSIGYETSFTDQSDLYQSMKAIHSCIGQKVGIGTNDPKVLTGMAVIRGKENIELELCGGGLTPEDANGCILQAEGLMPVQEAAPEPEWEPEL